MPYEILEHGADAGVRGIGRTLEEAFAEAARAMFSLMVELAAVRPCRERAVEVKADDLGGLLVAWLGELLTLRDVEGLVFSDFSVEIGRSPGDLLLRGRARGEPLDPARHQPRLEVKAATYCGLRVGQEGGRYLAQCVVDV
ncbi:MAG: archease [Candidatus Bipolaricaulaceae bacterium]